VTRTYQIAIAGGGPAGLAAACLAAQEGMNTVILAPAHSQDLRTVALMQPAIRLLKYIGVWTPDLEARSEALVQLHIVDDTGHYVSAPTLKFRAEEIGETAFGWNVPLVDLLPQLKARAQELGATILEERAAHARTFIDHVELDTESGITISAPCAIAADGRNSMLRKAAGISVSSRDWKQKALIASFAHSQPHHGISTEYHRPGGLFTYVPQPHQRSSFVWMDRPDVIDALAILPGEKLAVEIQLATHGNLGAISDVSTTQSFSMITGHAGLFAANRVFLAGESAHAMPPIGAQGLNMSLRDAGHAIDTLLNSSNPGDAASCTAYHQLRVGDLTPRSAAISFMNHSLLSDSDLLAGLRATGLAMVHALPPIRKLVMEQGLSPRNQLPFAMRA
jgi:2-octaprenyl-6-methoxyphenol hydroxylase